MDRGRVRLLATISTRKPGATEGAAFCGAIVLEQALGAVDCALAVKAIESRVVRRLNAILQN
jgi:hypothetical protein